MSAQPIDVLAAIADAEDLITESVQSLIDGVQVDGEIHDPDDAEVVAGEEAVLAAFREARADVAELVAAGKRVDTAIMAWRMSGKPDLGELNAAQGDLTAALARFGGAR